jgi:hypothetical protein
MWLISWNILAGGGSRCAVIVGLLQRYDADIIVLQETLPARASDLCHALGSAPGQGKPENSGEGKRAPMLGK